MPQCLLLFSAQPYLSRTETPLAQLCRQTRALSTSIATHYPLLLPQHARLFHLPCRVLTVGDGNLSFSLSLANMLRTISTKTSLLQLVATTFDDQSSLHTKYPECIQITKRLERCGAKISHRINAISLPPTLGSFSTIVFNHPHLGIEDAACHRTLLAHFFHSGRSLLRSGGRILISLIEGQPERWKLVEEASRFGFVLVQQIPLHPLQFPEYEIKRTHSGRTFVGEHAKKQSNGSQSSTFYCFVQSSDAHMYNNEERTVALVNKKRKRNKLTANSSSSSTSSSSTSTSSTSTSSTSTSSTSNTMHACNICQRDFSTAQGLRTHTHQVHVLKLNANAKTVKCSICTRDFRSETALEQHMLAKHGADQTIQPHTRQYAVISKDAKTSGTDSSSQSNTSSDRRQKCLICRNTFANKATFDLHFTKLEPVVIKPSHACCTCGRIFGDERAVRQHSNFCNKRG